MMKIFCWYVFLLFWEHSSGFIVPSSRTLQSTLSVRRNIRPNPLHVSTAIGEGGSSPAVTKKKKTIQDLRAEGGTLTINTPIGALNPFAVYYGFVSLALGLPWLVCLKTCQLLYFISRGRFDPKVSVLFPPTVFDAYVYLLVIDNLYNLFYH